MTPSLSVSGPCELDGTENPRDAASIPFFSPTDAGTCHATITLAGGESYSADFTFVPQWLSCGSDPHGCGQYFASDGGQWFINSCGDAGSRDATPDVASGDGHP